MGCSASKLEDEEAVQLCKDRKNFIKDAVEHRTRFASGHLAYIQSLKRVSAALREYIEGDEPREFLLDSFLTPIKKTNPGFISISPTQLLPGSNSSVTINCLRSSGGNRTVLVEERPQSPERVQMNNYSPAPNFGIDGFFAMQQSSSSMSPNPYFSYDSSYPNNRNIPPRFPPPSPQNNSQWDFFWNPFSSLDNYGYPTRSSIDNTVMDDEIRGLRQVREEEGIPELEEETEHECDHDDDDDDTDNVMEQHQRRGNNMQFSNVHNLNHPREEVLVEDIDDEDEDDDEEIEEIDCDCGHENGAGELQSHASRTMEVKQPPQDCSRKVEIISKPERTVASDDKKSKEEKPGFTVYVNKRPTSMAEVIRDLDTQFVSICNSASEVSGLLEVSRAQHSPSNDHSAMKMLNPVALFRSASSRSTSSRFLMSSSTPNSKDEGYESSSDFSDESSMFSGSHQSTLDRLYAWEKKLYEEVKSGERVRIAYEKKCTQLRNQDVKGDDPTSVDKTRATIRDLHTQIKVSIHSVEAISKRIETLRDDELQPQLAELVQGLSRMWKVMAECHRIQKRTLDEAKVLLAGTPSKLEARRRSHISITDPCRLARSASNLETELRNWKSCFESWIGSQRSYLRSLTSWLLRCVRSDPETSGKFPFSPRRSSATLPIFGLCIQWSRLLDSLQEMPVLDGLDFFAAGMGSIYEQQMKDDSRRVPGGSKRFGSEESPEKCMEIVEVGEVEEVMTAEKMADVAIRVLCAGMSVAVSSLTAFAVGSADGYAELVNQWEHAKRRHDPGSKET